MRPYRNLKIASVIEHELSMLLAREFDFGNALVTVTSVSTDSDLLRARVKLAIIPYEKGPEVFAAIERRKRELQRKLTRAMNIRPMPHLVFELESQEEPTAM